MTKRIEFTVEGKRPPIKDGANSMWGKEDERELILVFRQKALEEMKKNGIGIFTSFVKLELVAYSPDLKGDLDNFLTGICDAMQRANAAVLIPESYLQEPWNFGKSLVITDDRNVISIVAEKRRGPRKYVVAVEEISLT